MKKEFKLIFKEEVHQTILESYKCYENKSEGLGEKFLNSISICIKSIQKSPNGFRKIDKFRQIPLVKFPFVIVYEVMNDSLIIYALFHTKQDPIKKIN